MSISRPGCDETLGHVLVANGTMSQDQLDFALILKYAQPAGQTLGEILIQIGLGAYKHSGAASHRDGLYQQRFLLTALSKQFNMSILSMKNYLPTPEFQKVIR